MKSWIVGMPNGWNLLRLFHMSSTTNKVKENVVTNALSQWYVLLTILDTELLGFEHVKELYPNDIDFGDSYVACENGFNDKFYRHNHFLFKEDKLCMLKYSICELLVRESHEGGLMGHFGVRKT